MRDTEFLLFVLVAQHYFFSCSVSGVSHALLSRHLVYFVVLHQVLTHHTPPLLAQRLAYGVVASEGCG